MTATAVVAVDTGPVDPVALDPMVPVVRDLAGPVGVVLVGDLAGPAAHQAIEVLAAVPGAMTEAAAEDSAVVMGAASTMLSRAVGAVLTGEHDAMIAVLGETVRGETVRGERAISEAAPSVTEADNKIFGVRTVHRVAGARAQPATAGREISAVLTLAIGVLTRDLVADQVRVAGSETTTAVRGTRPMADARPRTATAIIPTAIAVPSRVVGATLVPARVIGRAVLGAVHVMIEPEILEGDPLGVPMAPIERAVVVSRIAGDNAMVDVASTGPGAPVQDAARGEGQVATVTLSGNSIGAASPLIGGIGVMSGVRGMVRATSAAEIVAEASAATIVVRDSLGGTIVVRDSPGGTTAVAPGAIAALRGGTTAASTEMIAVTLGATIAGSGPAVTVPTETSGQIGTDDPNETKVVIVKKDMFHPAWSAPTMSRQRPRVSRSPRCRCRSGPSSRVCRWT